MNQTFNVVSGKVCLSDPCYKVGTWCGKYNVPAMNGKWLVSYEEIDKTIYSFTAHHEDIHKIFYTADWINDLGVDSGQFGIFDASIYDGGGDFDEPGFYKDCCDATLSKANCGIIQGKGFVSSSGYGDGNYSAFALYSEEGELVSLNVVFVEEDEEDDWLDDWLDDDEDED